MGSNDKSPTEGLERGLKQVEKHLANLVLWHPSQGTLQASPLLACLRACSARVISGWQVWWGPRWSRFQPGPCILWGEQRDGPW